MSKKIIKYLAAFFLFIIAGVMITAKPCQAASAEIEISADTTEVTLGDSLFVYITVSSDILFGDFEANVTYDDEILDYQSVFPAITGSNGFLKISDIGVSDGTDVRKYTLKFEATKLGVCEISFREPIMVYEYETGDGMSVSSNVLNINVKAAETASDNAFLNSLKTSPSELTPAFDKNVFEYSTNIGYETEKLIINALPEDNKSTVSISGNEILKEGENKIIITVLAESGAVIEYTINVLRDKAPIVVTDGSTITPGAAQSAFKVIQIEGDIFAVYEGKYKLVEPGSEVNIPTGYVKTKVILSDISINAYSPENDLDNDFRLLYATNELGESGFYRYDRIEKTMQRFVPQEAYGFDNVAASNTDEIIQSAKYHANLNKAALAIAILSVICILLAAVSIRLFLKSRGYKEDDLN